MWSSLLMPTLLFLSISSLELAQIAGSATDENDSYPPFWDQISGSIAEFPMKNNKTIIGPWEYMDRLQMNKILITKSDKYFNSYGQKEFGQRPVGTHLIVWGAIKNRFSEPSNSSVCAYNAEAPGCISINSGWGGFNFYVIVLPCLSALETGFLGDVPLEVELLSREEHRSNFCYSIAECRASYPQAMDAAKQYFQYLQNGTLFSIISDIHRYIRDKDKAILYMWEMHQAAIDVGTPKFSDISQYSSAAGRKFTKDFLIAIKFCEIARYRSDFESSVEFLVGYPHGLLTDQEHHFLTNDFSIREKALLMGAKLISEIYESTGGSFLAIWKEFMKTKLERAMGRFLIKKLLLIPSF